MEAPRRRAHRVAMHQAETRALRRATLLLVIISLARLGWASRSPSVTGEGDSVLPALLDASREAADEETRRSTPLAEGELVDPNRADEIALDRLPGVGPAIASAIVAAREAGAVFGSAEDLLAVSGIGPATLDRIRASLDLSRAPPRERERERASPQRDPVGGLVDINTAGLQELQGLPGIGPALAERILTARGKQTFTSVDNLIRVRGIGPASIRRLRPYATVGRVR